MRRIRFELSRRDFGLQHLIEVSARPTFCLWELEENNKSHDGGSEEMNPLLPPRLPSSEFDIKGEPSFQTVENEKLNMNSTGRSGFGTQRRIEETSPATLEPYPIDDEVQTNAN